MKTLFTSLALALTFAAQSQITRFNGFPLDANTSERLKGSVVEVYVDGVLQETKQVKGRKIKVKHVGKGAVIIKVSKAGYDDYFFGMDYSAAPADTKSALDIPVKMTLQGTGKGDESLTMDWIYNPKEETPIECNVVTQGELKARLKG